MFLVDNMYTPHFFSSNKAAFNQILMVYNKFECEISIILQRGTRHFLILLPKQNTIKNQKYKIYVVQNVVDDSEQNQNLFCLVYKYNTIV